jgi:tight adherence protein C
MIMAVILLEVYNPLFLAILGAGGFLVPLSLLKERVKARHKAIFRQVPDVLDMITLMIEAGLDFNTALEKVLATEKGPLVDEFAAAQQEVKLGKSRSEAFSAMIERIKYPTLNTVINSISLALRTGGSLAPTLRSLASQFRVERSQLAEKMAAEAPVKLMGPLVLLIFPTIFIILFGPILLSFMSNG